MCILRPDHCAHHWIQISSTMPQQGQSHMDREHVRTRDPSTGTGSLAVLELWKKRTHSKDILRQHYFSRMHKIGTLSHYHFILLFTISSCVHCCSVLFPRDCPAFWVFCYYNLYQSYQHVLCIVHVLPRFVVVHLKYNVKR